MNLPRKVAVLLFSVVALAAIARYLQWELPTLRWFFSFNPDLTIEFSLSRLNVLRWLIFIFPKIQNPIVWVIDEDVIGSILLCFIFIAGVFLWIWGKHFAWNPITLRRFKGFRSIKRGYYSFLLMGVLLCVAMLDQAIVGREALVVRYQGKWHFPAFVRNKPKLDFPSSTNSTTDYRSLKAHVDQQNNGDFVLMPLIPWDSTFDTQDLEKIPMILRDGIYYREKKSEPYQGIAISDHPDAPGKKFIETTFRKGVPHGEALFFDPSGNPIGQRKYELGQALPSETSPASSIPANAVFHIIEYSPTAPNWKSGHLLGTDARGWDVAAQLFGGFQVVVKASILYVFLTFFIGIVVGLVSGYFGGIYDLVTQRVLEILQNMPFLLIVMIIAARVGRENVNIFTIVSILCLFSWIGISLYKRTAALKEKARDYVAAARVMGASTPRILFHHILPNVLSTSITLVPFTVTAIATSLTALDFIGFGLPDKYPSWGTLLENGLSNLEAPWIVSSVFILLFLILLLITFVGEAIREAFDPKKFTTYQ